MTVFDLTAEATNMAALRADAAHALSALADDEGLRLLRLDGKSLLPVAQAGMGVGVSARGLAGTVAAMGGVGTLSSVDLMTQTEHLCKEREAKARINAAHLEALSREIQRTRKLAQGRGLLAVKVMKTVSEYEVYVRRALASGIEAVVVVAWLPLDSSSIAKDYPDVALIPILSDARGVQLVVRKSEKKRRLRSAIAIEHPRLAGGHQGAAKVADLQDGRFEFEVVIPQLLELFKTAGIEREIPVIAAGGIYGLNDLLQLQAFGASAVQLGTKFAVKQ